MSQTPTEPRVWRSPNAVMMMAIAVALVVLSACGGLIYYASAAVNGITEAREARLMDRSVERRLERLKDDVASVAVWSDAYDFTGRRFDPEWAQVNYGTYFHQYLHHDVSLVLDARDRPIYGSVAGTKVEPADLAAFVAASGTLVADVRHRAEQKIAAAPGSLAFDRVGAAQATVRVGSRIFLVSASTVVPEPEYTKALLPVPDPIVISAVELNAGYLKALDRDYGLKGAKLLPPGSPARPLTVLRGADGAALAAIGWTPERPGVGVYRDAMWAILALALVVITAVSLMIQRLRRMAHDVETARDRAEAGDRAKADFIANMSHEIRTPLNGVLGMAQALDRHDLLPEQRACVKVIRDSGATLLAVLNDVLDLSKIEAGKLEIVDAVCRLDELGQRVCATFSELAAAKDIDLTVRVEAAAVGLWIGDALRIVQVLSNLVSNAVKFTERGSVTLRIEAVDLGVRFSVTDTGVGLTAEQLPGLFEKFSQADATTTRRYGGTGLGLSICRDLVYLMGGAIEVRSDAGQGSTFSVTLPLTRAGAESAPCPPSVEAVAPTRPLRVLAAEDNPTNQLVLRALFGPLDADLTLTWNGREAVAAFAAGAFDVVLMDVQMPEMDGPDATRAIRALEAIRGGFRTPILAVTANVMSHQVESYLAAGMDGHVAKPLDAAALYAALECVLSASPCEQRAAA